MKIAVTAANGQLGRAIVQELKAEIGAENVIGIARTPQKATSLGIEIRKGDYDVLDDFIAAFEGIDRVLLVSGMDAPKKRIQQHRKIILAAEKNNVKKLVYTSILGDEQETAFSPIINSNRQTERDIANSKLDWVVGRNGLYIEPDLEYLPNYIKTGYISNCAGQGKCAYTSRQELAKAYAKMLLSDDLKSKIFNLTSTPITQAQLANQINSIYKTSLTYKYVSDTEYLEDRKKELGSFIGTVVAGIYEGIKKGSFDVQSDFEKVVGRSHKTVIELIETFKNDQQ